MSTHVGRSWFGHPLEDACPCPQEPCGLVDSSRAADSCPEHRRGAAKTMRQRHSAAMCPGPGGRRPRTEREPEPETPGGDVVARIVQAILAEARAVEPTTPPDQLLTYAGGLRRAARIAKNIAKEDT